MNKSCHIYDPVLTVCGAMIPFKSGFVVSVLCV